MTLGELRTALYDSLGYQSVPASDVVRRLDYYLNMTYRELLTMRSLAKLRRSVLTFATQANLPMVTLPQAVVRIAGIQDRTTQKSLREVLIQDIRAWDPGLTAKTSNPDAYAVINYAAACTVDFTLPSTRLYLVSDSAADLAVVRLSGVTLAGYARMETVTLTGTTQVGTPTLDWQFVQRLTVDAPAVGNIQLIQPADGSTWNTLTNIEVARIPPGRSAARYTRLHLYGTPTQGLTYYADVELHVEDLLSLGDTPVLPEDFHYLLMTGAMKKDCWRRRDWNAFNAADTDWKIGVGALKGWVGQRTDDGRTGRELQYSQLGPWYRAGT